MTDSDEKPKDLLSTLIRSARQQIDKGSGWIEMPLHEHLQFLEYVSRLLDTTRSERDATLARVGEYLDAHAALGRLYDTTEECKAAIEREERAFNALRAALTPPAYPPEQPL